MPPVTEKKSSWALLVVDMQAPLLQNTSPAKTALRRCHFAIKAARLLEAPILFTEQSPQKLQPILPELRALAPEAPVFAKSAFSALQEPGLRETLNQNGTTHLLLAGLETTICIYQTALEGQTIGLDVTLLSDCLAARRPQDAATVLQALSHAHTHILPSETVFYSLLANATHPHFRRFTQLVKNYA